MRGTLERFGEVMSLVRKNGIFPFRFHIAIRVLIVFMLVLLFEIKPVVDICYAKNKGAVRAGRLFVYTIPMISMKGFVCFMMNCKEYKIHWLFLMMHFSYMKMLHFRNRL